MCGRDRCGNALASQGVRPDVAIVDPPRKGCAPEVFAAIDKMGIERLVYVSCDPATLARDLALLATMGYTARRACGVDLFPRTPHVETVVLLSHKKPTVISTLMWSLERARARFR